MKTTVVDNEFVKSYFSGKKHKNYHRAVDIKNHMEFHFNGYFRKTDVTGDVQIINEKQNPYFKRLIDMRRPSESDPIMNYRRNIYLPITKIPCHKITNSLKKIVKSQDWNIDYSSSDYPASLPDKETLKYYCEENYPFFDSVENWAETYVINQMFKDPNAVVVVIPMNFDKESSEFYQPYSYIISSRKVLDYSMNEYVVYEEKDDDKLDQIKHLKIITTDSIYDAIRADKDKFIITQIKHDLGYLPAFIMGGIPLQISEKMPLYESFLSSILPELDAAAQEHSDLQGAIVQHLYPTMWYFASQECNSCHGTGNVIKEGKNIICEQCEGDGRLTKSPYKDMKLNTGGFDEKQVPTPPAGIIDKSSVIAIVQLQEKRVQDHITRALSAINMEYLSDTPLNQSGKAKEIDRDELNNFVYQIAYHLVENILKPIYYFINEWRYKDYVPVPETRENMLPRINIPERFDLLTENIVGEQLAQAITNKFSDEIIENLEMEYVGIHFNNHPDILERVKAKKELDPFAGKNNDEKNNLLLQGDVPKSDVITSIYIDNFITRAIIENKNFLKLEYAKQKVIMDKYCADKMKEMQPSDKVKKIINNLNQNPNEL